MRHLLNLSVIPCCANRLSGSCDVVFSLCPHLYYYYCHFYTASQYFTGRGNEGGFPRHEGKKGLFRPLSARSVQRNFQREYREFKRDREFIFIFYVHVIL